MTSFCSLSALDRLNKNNMVIKLKKVLDWKSLEKRLKGIYKMDLDDLGGESPYDP
jgi:hypothetical protein